MPENLYFIAVIPPKHIQHRVTDYKELMSHRFGSKHALKSPPHITLIPPFWWPDEDLKQLLADLRDWSGEKTSFEIELSNFDCFKPRVIFIDILPNEKLNSLQAALKNRLKKSWGLLSDHRDKFHPHLTIAFKDLKPSSFYRAWDLFKDQEYIDSFVCCDLQLLKYEGERWHLHESFAIGMSITER
jgi:2'-5' RNA ligase